MGGVGEGSRIGQALSSEQGEDLSEVVKMVRLSQDLSSFLKSVVSAGEALSKSKDKARSLGLRPTLSNFSMALYSFKHSQEQGSYMRLPSVKVLEDALIHKKQGIDSLTRMH